MPTLTQHILRRHAQKSHLELNEDFHAFDGNGDGRMDRAEFVAYVRHLDERMDRGEILFEFAALDTDRDGLIDFSEFLAWWRSQ